MRFETVHQSLFDTDSKYVLAHCISNDVAMGVAKGGKKYGIASEFNDRYPDMKPYIKSIKVKNAIGKSYIYMYVGESENRIIINMITKDRYWDKPTYDTLTMALMDMKELCLTMNIRHLAMPTIASHLDRLDWDKVKEIIQDTFKDTKIEILICIKPK